MNICTMYTIRNCLYLPGKRPYMLHRKRVRAEMIFHISKAKIRAAMRPPLSLHMQLTEDAGLESRGCAALHGTYYVASSLAALSKIRSSVQDRSVGLRMEATRKRRTHTHSVDLVSQVATLLRAAQNVLPTSEQTPVTDSP